MAVLYPFCALTSLLRNAAFHRHLHVLHLSPRVQRSVSLHCRPSVARPTPDRSQRIIPSRVKCRARRVGGKTRGPVRFCLYANRLFLAKQRTSKQQTDRQMDMAHGRTDGRTSAPPINTVNPNLEDHANERRRGRTNARS